MKGTGRKKKLRCISLHRKLKPHEDHHDTQKEKKTQTHTHTHTHTSQAEIKDDTSRAADVRECWLGGRKNGRVVGVKARKLARRKEGRLGDRVERRKDH